MNETLCMVQLRLNPERLIPVSYTHLDVYKRQGLVSSESRGNSDQAR